MDLEKARQGLSDYYKMAKSKQAMRPQDVKDFMEPIFVEAGFRQPPAQGQQPKILIIRDDAAGDFVLFSAFLREARRIYSGAQIVLLCSSRNRDLAEHCPYIDTLLMNSTLDNINGTNADQALQAVIRVAMKLQEYNFDLAFSPRLGIRSFGILTAYMSGATQVIGFTQDRVNEDTNTLYQIGWDCLMTVAIPIIYKPMSDVARNLYMLEYLTHMPIQNRKLEVWCTEVERQRAAELLAPLQKHGCEYLIAVVPVASLRMNQWPIKRYIALCKWILTQNPKAGIVIMGGPNEITIANTLRRALGGYKRTICLAGKTNFRVSAALMSMCNIYVGNDTGLMHIAAACKLPVLTLMCFPATLQFSNMSNPVRFRPYMVPAVIVLPATSKGDECHARQARGCVHENEPHCILNVSVEAMKAGYTTLLQRAADGINKLLILKS